MSLVLGLGLEHSCPWPREVLSSKRLSLASDFFCVLGLGLGLEPCVLDSTSANILLVLVYESKSIKIYKTEHRQYFRGTWRKNVFNLHFFFRANTKIFVSLPWQQATKNLNMHAVSKAGISQTITITNNIDRNSSTTGARRLEKSFSVFVPIHPAELSLC